MAAQGRRFRSGLLPILGALVVAVSVVSLLVGRMPRVPWFLAGAGALFGVVLAVYEGIKEREPLAGWYTMLLVYPLLFAFVMFLGGLLILFLYNLIAHGFAGLNYP
jgi:hypothetical protein